MAYGHGGKRPGQRPPTGLKWPKTLEKERARELVRHAITEHLQPLIEAQVANAKGLKYLVARDVKTGKFQRLAAAQVDGSEAQIEVWEKDPSIEAFKELLERALDKSTAFVSMNVTQVNTAEILKQRHARHSRKP